MARTAAASSSTAATHANRFFERARALGVKIVAVHKGVPLPGLEYEYSSPRDMGPAAVANPDLTFLVYHGGFEGGKTEGPYNPDNPQGVDRLIKSHQDAGLRRNQGNLYAEMGSLWRYFMTRPDEAAHVIGKLLKYFGEERIMWGTDSIWYGSPQDQIQAFRAFRISEEFQERYGYPALTAEAKRKIFGLNGARVYEIDVAALHGRGALARAPRRLSRTIPIRASPPSARRAGANSSRYGMRAAACRAKDEPKPHPEDRQMTRIALPPLLRPARRLRALGGCEHRAVRRQPGGADRRDASGPSATTRRSRSANGARRCRTISAALEFGPAGAPPLFSLRCDARRGVLLQRHGQAPAGDLPVMLVSVGSETRRLAVTARRRPDPDAPRRAQRERPVARHPRPRAPRRSRSGSAMPRRSILPPQPADRRLYRPNARAARPEPNRAAAGNEAAAGQRRRTRPNEPARRAIG